MTTMPIRIYAIVSALGVSLNATDDCNYLIEEGLRDICAGQERIDRESEAALHIEAQR